MGRRAGVVFWDRLTVGVETWVGREAGWVDSGRTEHDRVGGEEPGNMVYITTPPILPHKTSQATNSHLIAPQRTSYNYDISPNLTSHLTLTGISQSTHKF
ncbi:hypothetical protein Pcinc_032646 [Petrolisthes cinctipes]|uniref:Uncharacterized protein n=1 Tax=Petrolisthes cinctipes TaxID=88211 RepID=A0AAE1EU53_PETCI|nr:hypothetical protein Pcinc_032646 [Petrolisthes cinctipes]